VRFQSDSAPENDRLSSYLGEINVEFVEREATPQLLMKLSIQRQLARVLLSNTVLFLRYLVLIAPAFSRRGSRLITIQL